MVTTARITTLALLLLAPSTGRAENTLDTLFRENIVDLRINNWRPMDRQGAVNPDRMTFQDWTWTDGRHQPELRISKMRKTGIGTHVPSLNDLGQTIASVRKFRLKTSGNTSAHDLKTSFRVSAKNDTAGKDDAYKGLGGGFKLRAANRDGAAGLREHTSLQLFREMGVAAPRSTFARVSANDGKSAEGYLGLYLLTEKINSKGFLKQHFGTKKADVFKLNIFGGIRVKADFKYRGDDPRSYFPTGKTGYDLKRSEDAGRAQRDMVEFIKVINGKTLPQGQGFGSQAYYDAVNRVCNADRIIKWLAGNMVLGAWDQLATPSNAFFVNSRKSGRAYFDVAAWDYNHASGSSPFKRKSGGWVDYAKMPVDRAMDYQLKSPVSRPLLDNLLKHPRFKLTYAKALKSAADKMYGSNGIIARMVRNEGRGGRGDKIWNAIWFESAGNGVRDPWNQKPHTGRFFTASQTYKQIFGHGPSVYLAWERQPPLRRFAEKRHRYVMNAAGRMESAARSALRGRR